ncbi:hypothetical protein KAFR_0E01900 [Kazachstania africana CBS 2517]|uniref:Peroxisomal membrane protein PEX14-like KPWE domain-containing protein n=1 Tax=Kazachstania africana (strain ATCC 22294 / BCRC 22015 / CBS 2517 / CECT 1963 / NBRC 1671 / NRRL Y-8276) TaxID=1071382 RepID=H2AVE4_KAZAF|nr:hypothetical protein KAFR_0E01900 [Kazachstania africana CBS 2517]CCF58344.1 hypothetical protein KAFR_0E01900 [Kazachstania africana CBS 2517]
MSEDLSYEELVDHIVNDKPVPNVVNIPNVVHSEAMRTESTLTPRLKPWEIAQHETNEQEKESKQQQ